MLIVSPAVMSAFEQERRHAFVERAIDHASDFQPARFGALTMASRHAAVLDTIALAEQFGVVSEKGTIQFLEVRCLLGFDFLVGERHAWARRLLESQWTDENRTMDYLSSTALSKARETTPPVPNENSARA